MEYLKHFIHFTGTGLVFNTLLHLSLPKMTWVSWASALLRQCLPPQRYPKRMLAFQLRHCTNCSHEDHMQNIG